MKRKEEELRCWTSFVEFWDMSWIITRCYNIFHETDTWWKARKGMKEIRKSGMEEYIIMVSFRNKIQVRKEIKNSKKRVLLFTVDCWVGREDLEERLSVGKGEVGLFPVESVWLSPKPVVGSTAAAVGLWSCYRNMSHRLRVLLSQSDL